MADDELPKEVLAVGNPGATIHDSSSNAALVDGDFDNKVTTAKLQRERRPKPPRCGWCCWRPMCLQPCYRWPFALVVLCWFSFIQGFTSQGLNAVNSGSLERRFKLSSTEIGWFNAVQKLAAASSTILFSYLADRFHKPRWLMFSASLFCIGCFIISLPHYIAEPYNANSFDQINTCHSPSSLTGQHNVTTTTDHCSASKFKTSSWLNVLMAGNVIMGVGAGIIFTVGVAFIDDFSDPASSSMRVGIMYFFSAIGAAAGFGGGSALLQLDVNFNRPDWPVFQGTKELNPHYVGAWWLGYAIATAAFGTVAFALSCFDFEMPQTAAVRLKKTSETHKISIKIGEDASNRPKLVTVFLKFIGALVKFCLNPVLIWVTIASILHSLMAEGIAPFFQILVRSLYVVNATKAGMALAVIIVVSIGSGTIFSGYILKRFQFTLRGMLLLVLLAVVVVTFLGFGFYIHCPGEKISGVTVDYDKFAYYDPVPQFDKKNVLATCNARCSCSPNTYQPVCQPKLGIQFFSPCHGACRVQRNIFIMGHNITVYAGCDCLAPFFFKQQNFTASEQSLFMSILTVMPGDSTGGEGSNNNTNINLQLLSAVMANGNISVNPFELMTLAATMRDQRDAYRNFSATTPLIDGVCDASCGNFYGAMVLIFFLLFFGYVTVVPVAEIIMRCVPESDRSVALAFHQAIARFFGAIPGPIMMGAIIDRVCVFRDPNKCEGDEGGCFAYDVPSFSRWLTGLFFGLHAIAIICYILALALYKPPSGETLKQYLKRLLQSKQEKRVVGDNKTEIHENPAYASQNSIENVVDSKETTP